MYVILERRGKGQEIAIIESLDADRPLMEATYNQLVKDAKEQKIDVTYRLEHFAHYNIDHLQMKPEDSNWIVQGEE